MIVDRDLRRVPCVRAVIDWTGQAFAEQRDLIAGANQITPRKLGEASLLRAMARSFFR